MSHDYQPPDGRDIEQDIAKYAHHPEIIRKHYKERSYPESDEQFVIRWLRRADSRNEWSEGANAVAANVLGLGLLGAVFFVLYQFGLWLYYGHWYEYDMLWLFRKAGYSPGWLKDPESWVGLSRIVHWCLDVHISIQLLLVSGTLAGVLALTLNAVVAICKPLPDPHRRRHSK